MGLKRCSVALRDQYHNGSFFTWTVLLFNTQAAPKINKTRFPSRFFYHLKCQHRVGCRWLAEPRTSLNNSVVWAWSWHLTFCTADMMMYLTWMWLWPQWGLATFPFFPYFSLLGSTNIVILNLAALRFSTLLFTCCFWVGSHCVWQRDISVKMWFVLRNMIFSSLECFHRHHGGRVGVFFFLNDLL